MTNRLSKQAATTYSPAVEEVIASPARCVTTVTYELRTFWKYVFVDNGRSWYWYSVPYTKRVEVSRYECFPAVEGVEGRDAGLVVDNQPGWNAGARSVKSIGGDLTTTFVIKRSSIGVLAGLVDLNFEPGSFNSVRHGVLAVAGQTIKIVENGVEKQDTGLAFSSDVPVTISRYGSVVRYTIGTYSYTSTTPSAGDKRLGASLYMAGDSVDSPSITGAALLSSRSSWAWSDNEARGKMRVRVPWGWSAQAAVNDGYVATELPFSLKASDYDYGYVSLVLDDASIAVDALSGFIDVEAFGIQFPVPLGMMAVVQDTDFVSVDMAMGMTLSAYDYEYTTVLLEIDDEGIEIFVLEDTDPAGTNSSAEAVAVIDEYVFDPVVFAELAEVLEVGSEISVYIMMTESLAEYLVLSDEATMSMIIEAMLAHTLSVSDSAADIRRALAQYSTNLETGAVTRYQNFEFDGFVRVGIDTYAWKKGGIYKLSGSTDDGTSIDAAVEFAAEDFGSARHKRMDTVFFGLATDGDVYVKLLDDEGVENVYRAYERGGEFRADFERGRSSRYWRLKLELADATDAVLDNIEWVPGVSGRRTGR